jgi:hypothetical protein
MTVLTVTIVDQAFDRKSAEVAYLQRVLDTLKNELGRGQGNPVMTKTKVENAGMTAPKPPTPTGPHISEPVRAKLADLNPEIAAHVREVADTK